MNSFFYWGVIINNRGWGIIFSLDNPVALYPSSR